MLITIARHRRHVIMQPAHRSLDATVSRTRGSGTAGVGADARADPKSRCSQGAADFGRRGSGATGIAMALDEVREANAGLHRLCF